MAQLRRLQRLPIGIGLAGWRDRYPSLRAGRAEAVHVGFMNMTM
jgi:hypothetical protein